MVYASEKGASIWLSVLPLQDQNLHLHKSSFRDALCLRYGWEPPRLPSMCVCGSPFTVQHCLSCNVGGYPIMRHNDLRDHTAALMSTVCSDVTTEPQLQPLSGEQLSLLSANSDGNARLDVAATNFWSSNNQRSFFDIRVFNPLASSNRASSANSVYQKHEREKRRGYEQRVREIENGCFSPLVFNTLGGMGPTAQVVYKQQARRQGGFGGFGRTAQATQRSAWSLQKLLYWLLLTPQIAVTSVEDCSNTASFLVACTVRDHAVVQVLTKSKNAQGPDLRTRDL